MGLFHSFVEQKRKDLKHARQGLLAQRRRLRPRGSSALDALQTSPCSVIASQVPVWHGLAKLSTIMKSLEQNEIFENLSGFLKARGIELKDGSYAQGIQKSCALLTNAINLGQESFGRAKVEFDKTMQHLRRVIHEKTAPRPPRTAAGKTAAPGAKPPRTAKPKAAKSKRQAGSQRKGGSRKAG